MPRWALYGGNGSHVGIVQEEGEFAMEKADVAAVFAVMDLLIRADRQVDAHTLWMTTYEIIYGTSTD